MHQETPGELGVRGVSDPLPPAPRPWGPSLSSHLARARRVFICAFPRKGPPLLSPRGATPPACGKAAPLDAPGPAAGAAESPLRCPQAGPASEPGRAALTARREPPASCRAAPSPRPAPLARAAAQQGPHREAFQVRGRHGELRTGRAGRGEHPGPRRGQAGCGTRSARAAAAEWIQYGHFLETPLGRGGGRSRGAAPAPARGTGLPARPGPERSRSPRRWDGRGSPPRGGRCPLRGLLGLVVGELGGRGGQCLGRRGPVPAGLPRVPGRPGTSPGGSVGARALGSPFRGGGWWGAA